MAKDEDVTTKGMVEFLRLWKCSKQMLPYLTMI